MDNEKVFAKQVYHTLNLATFDGLQLSTEIVYDSIYCWR